MIATPEWSEIINELISSPGVVMVVGGVDVGKTRFCTELASAAFDAGIPAAVVDADVGQSEIGAPGTIGMAIVDKPFQVLSDLKPKRLYFVGATSPAAHLLECVIGTKKMVDAALSLNAKLIIVDTTGLIDGHVGRKLKTYKADLLRPDYLVGIQKKKEVEHLLVPFSKISSIKIRRIGSSENARNKPPELRASRRSINFRQHFQDSMGHIIHLDQVCFWNTWFMCGRPLKWQYMKFVEESLKCRVLHAEVSGRGIFIVSERECNRQGYLALEETFGTSNITIITGESFKNLLVGLADENGNTLNVGLLQAIDFKQKFLFVLSPIKTISPVRIIKFGSMRVTREGRELGIVRPGEL